MSSCCSQATTVQFTTLEFFQNRTDISELIFSQLRAEMWKSFAELKYFQVREGYRGLLRRFVRGQNSVSVGGQSGQRTVFSGAYS